LTILPDGSEAAFGRERASTPSGMMSPSLTKLGMASARAEGMCSSSPLGQMAQGLTKENKQHKDPLSTTQRPKRKKKMRRVFTNCG